MSYPQRPAWRGQAARRDPFAALEAMQDRVNRMLGDAFTGYRGRTPGWHPDIDVDEDGDGWLVEVRLPGVAPDEVAIDMTDRELTISSASAEGDEGSVPGEEEVPATRTARRTADFRFRLTLPAPVDAAGIDATMDHGLLMIRLPRSTTANTRRINVGGRAGSAGTPTMTFGGSAAGADLDRDPAAADAAAIADAAQSTPPPAPTTQAPGRDGSAGPDFADTRNPALDADAAATADAASGPAGRDGDVAGGHFR